MSEINEQLVSFVKRLAPEIDCINRETKVMDVRFFKSSFRKQGYTDKVFIPWRNCLQNGGQEQGGVHHQQTDFSELAEAIEYPYRDHSSKNLGRDSQSTFKIDTLF